jgi:hypothetical protein
MKLIITVTGGLCDACNCFIPECYYPLREPYNCPNCNTPASEGPLNSPNKCIHIPVEISTNVHSELISGHIFLPRDNSDTLISEGSIDIRESTSYPDLPDEIQYGS